MNTFCSSRIRSRSRTSCAKRSNKGAYMAAPSFDNAENIRVWLRFHEDLSRGLKQARFAQTTPVRAGVSLRQASLAACIYHTGELDLLRDTLQSLAAQNSPPANVLIAVDAPERGRGRAGQGAGRRTRLAVHGDRRVRHGCRAFIQCAGRAGHRKTYAAVPVARHACCSRMRSRCCATFPITPARTC